MTNMLDQLPWHALHTEHAGLAECAPRARKYQAEVAPFAGLADFTDASVRELVALLQPGETTYVMGVGLPVVPGMVAGETFPALQMTSGDARASSLAKPDAGDAVVLLTAADAQAMVDLTSLAFPGFFRRRTCEMGVYYGIRKGGELVAMAGERMALPRAREISAVCTHPAHTGKGYAARLVMRLMRQHAAAGLQSFLHVSPANARALSLYRSLGFSVRKEICLQPVTRKFDAFDASLKTS